MSQKSLLEYQEQEQEGLVDGQLPPPSTSLRSDTKYWVAPTGEYYDVFAILGRGTVVDGKEQWVWHNHFSERFLGLKTLEAIAAGWVRVGVNVFEQDDPDANYFHANSLESLNKPILDEMANLANKDILVETTAGAGWDFKNFTKVPIGLFKNSGMGLYEFIKGGKAINPDEKTVRDWVGDSSTPKKKPLDQTMWAGYVANPEDVPHEKAPPGPGKGTDWPLGVFQSFNLELTAGMKPAFTAKQLAKKHKVSVKIINKLLDEGQKIEREHTTNSSEARRIASHHIWEFLHYYKELKKMERRLEKQAKTAHSTQILYTYSEVSPVEAPAPKKELDLDEDYIDIEAFKSFESLRDVVLGLDFDLTITANPKAFSILVDAIRAAGGKAYLVTARPYSQSNAVERYLRDQHILLDGSFYFPEEYEQIDFESDPDKWWAQHLKYKKDVIMEHGITHFVDDSSKYYDFVTKYKPGLYFFQAKTSTPHPQGSWAETDVLKQYKRDPEFSTRRDVTPKPQYDPTTYAADKKRVILAAAGFNHPEWEGNFYPKGLKESDKLLHFAMHIPAVEINATTHLMPRMDVFERWAAQTPDEFTFLFRVVANRHLEDTLALLFDRASKTIGLNRLGPISVIIPKGRGYQKGDVARIYEGIPAHRYAFDIQSEHWVNPDVYEELDRLDGTIVRDHLLGGRTPGKWSYVRLPIHESMLSARMGEDLERLASTDVLDPEQAEVTTTVITNEKSHPAWEQIYKLRQHLKKNLGQDYQPGPINLSKLVNLAPNQGWDASTGPGNSASPSGGTDTDRIYGPLNGQTPEAVSLRGKENIKSGNTELTPEMGPDSADGTTNTQNKKLGETGL